MNRLTRYIGDSEVARAYRGLIPSVDFELVADKLEIHAYANTFERSASTTVGHRNRRS